MRLRVEFVRLWCGNRQAGVGVDAIRLHASDRVRAGIADQQVTILALRRAIDEGAQLTIVEALIAFGQSLESRRPVQAPVSPDFSGF